VSYDLPELSAFSGFSRDGQARDLWLNSAIGIAELTAYPVLMVTDHLGVIGAWLTLKTVAQWKVWAESRIVFNRFLIGNILVVFVAFLWLVHQVRTSTVACGGGDRSTHTGRASQIP
jgi:uncharacterized membrane protein